VLMKHDLAGFTLNDLGLPVGVRELGLRVREEVHDGARMRVHGRGDARLYSRLQHPDSIVLQQGLVHLRGDVNCVGMHVPSSFSSAVMAGATDPPRRRGGRGTRSPSGFPIQTLPWPETAPSTREGPTIRS